MVEGPEPILFVTGGCAWAQGLLDKLNERLARDPEFLDHIWLDDLELEDGQLAKNLPSEILDFYHEDIDQYLSILDRTGNIAYFIFIAVQDDSCKFYVPLDHRKLLFLFSVPPTNNNFVGHSYELDPYYLNGVVFDLMAEIGLFRMRYEVSLSD